MYVSTAVAPGPNDTKPENAEKRPNNDLIADLLGGGSSAPTAAPTAATNGGSGLSSLMDGGVCV